MPAAQARFVFGEGPGDRLRPARHGLIGEFPKLGFGQCWLPAPFSPCIIIEGHGSPHIRTRVDLVAAKRARSCVVLATTGKILTPRPQVGFGLRSGSCREQLNPFLHSRIPRFLEPEPLETSYFDAVSLRLADRLAAPFRLLPLLQSADVRNAAGTCQLRCQIFSRPPVAAPVPNWLKRGWISLRRPWRSERPTGFAYRSIRASKARLRREWARRSYRSSRFKTPSAVDALGSPGRTSSADSCDPARSSSDPSSVSPKSVG